MGTSESGGGRREHPRGYVAGTATLLPLGGTRGEYLVSDVSAGGVRLVGGPVQRVRTPARIILRLVGLQTVRPKRRFDTSQWPVRRHRYAGQW
jgi:hypothetical protein